MRTMNPDDLITIKTNDGKFNSRSVPGIGSVEILNDTTTSLLRAAKNDDLATFVQANPTWVANS
jgi:hypothetical protein